MHGSPYHDGSVDQAIPVAGGEQRARTGCTDFNGWIVNPAAWTGAGLLLFTVQEGMQIILSQAAR